jgi:hypothetical protein
MNCICGVAVHAVCHALGDAWGALFSLLAKESIDKNSLGVLLSVLLGTLFRNCTIIALFTIALFGDASHHETGTNQKCRPTHTPSPLSREGSNT